MKKNIFISILLPLVVLIFSCSSASDELPGANIEKISNPDVNLELEDITSLGFKKNKTYKVKDLPEAKSAYYGFLKIPKTLGRHVQEKQNREYRGGNLQLIHGSRMFLCHSTMNIIPKVGDFYFFPNYLMHTVFPFKDTNEERRSISFNAYIDDDVYDVYGR